MNTTMTTIEIKTYLEQTDPQFISRVLELYSFQKTSATEKLAIKIMEEYRIKSIRHDKDTEMWIYSDGIYIPHAKSYIKEFARAVLGDVYTTHNVNQIIAKIEADSLINQDEFFVEEDVNLVPVLNGILNLQTKELLPFNSDYRFFNKLPIEFNPELTCPVILHHLDEVLVNPADKRVIQEMFGYCLYRDYKFEKAFMLLGSGRNGKGKTIELLKRMLGADNCTNVSLQMLENDKFSLAELHFKMANLCDDLSRTGLYATGNFKQITGHGMLSAPRKFLTNIQFVNYAKMIFLANELPETNDTTVAFFDRWILIDFPFTFKAETEYKQLRETKNIKIADTDIINKLSTKSELSGLLNWSIEGLHRILSQNGFSTSYTSEQVNMKWMRKSNSFKAFCLDILTQNYDGRISKKDVRNIYNIYCKKNKSRPITDKQIKSIIVQMMGASDAQIVTQHGREYVWEGISFNETKKIELEEWEKDQDKNKKSASEALDEAAELQDINALSSNRQSNI